MTVHWSVPKHGKSNKSDMKTVFLLYETDEWTSRISMNLLFIGSSVKMCQRYIKRQYKDKLNKDKLEDMLHELGQ